MPLRNQSSISFLATAHPEASKHFFKQTVGLELIEETDFALVFGLYNVQLRIQKVPNVVPTPYTLAGWQVNDIESITTLLTEKGIVFEQHEGMTQSNKGIWTSPSGAKIAWFKDPDGNILSLTQQ